MLTPLKRRSVFKSSTFNDYIIAKFQQSYANDLDASVPSERKLLNQFYDHLTPLTPGYNEPTSHCVIAYDTESRLDYLKNFPRQLSFFLLQLGITEQFLLRFTDTNLLTEFPFENFTKKNRFKRLGAIKEPNTAYVVKTENVEKLLP